MAWAKIDDGWWCHPKTMNLTVSAAGLWALALSWSCHQRRDVVPRRFLAMVEAHEDHAKELVDAGLWHETPEGWQIHNWSDYQERTLSEKRADAGRKGGKASGEARREATDEAPPKQEPSKPKQTGEANDEAGALPGPTRPGPTEPEPHVVKEQFEDFWNRYPRGKADKPGGDGAKKPAWQKFRKLTDEQRALCLSAVDNYRAHIESPEGPYAAHAITWLNQERWEQWQEPARTHPPPTVHDDVCDDCGQVLGERHNDDTCEAIREGLIRG